MSTETLTILIATASFVVVWLICGFLIRRALKRGHISYAGNRPGSPTRTYYRAESPLGFWAGIFVIVFVGVICSLVAAEFVLAAYGINI